MKARLRIKEETRDVRGLHADTADEGTWLQVAQECDYATFFHTPIWQRAVLGAYPHSRGAALQAQLGSGAIVIYPLLEVGRHLNGMAKIYVSTFAGCYGGPIANGPLTSAENAWLHALVARRPSSHLEVTGNPLALWWRPPMNFGRTSDFTHIVGIGPRFDDVAKRFAHGIKSDITRARREGVAVAPAADRDDWKAYFRLYEEALVRWGERATSSYSWKLFENLHALARAYPGHIKLWAARKNGDLIGGALVFYWRNHAVYWHATSDHRYARLAPAKMVVATAIEDACSERFRYFDFNPSGGHAGVANFKASFGGEKWPIDRFRLVRQPLRAARFVKRRVTR